MMMFNKEAKTFKKNLAYLWEIPQGRQVLLYLYQVYVNRSCMSKDPNQTVYDLAQKELVQSLINDATTDVEKFLETVSENYNNE